MSEWTTEDPILKSPHGPHEPCAVMRMHRSGVSSQKILDVLKLRGTQLIKQIEESNLEVAAAERSGRPIHDVVIPKEKS